MNATQNRIHELSCPTKVFPPNLLSFPPWALVSLPGLPHQAGPQSHYLRTLGLGQLVDGGLRQGEDLLHKRIRVLRRGRRHGGRRGGGRCGRRRIRHGDRRGVGDGVLLLIDGGCGGGCAVGSGQVGRRDRRWGRDGGARVDDRVDSVGGHEVHEQQGLEDGIRQLRGLGQQLGGAGRVGARHGLHLLQDVEELGGRQRAQGPRDGVGRRHAGGEVLAGRERRQRGDFLLLLVRGCAGAVYAAGGSIVGVVCARLLVRKIHAQFTAHDFGVVQVADC